MKKNRIILLGLIVTLAACGSKNIDKFEKNMLSFDSLPDTVQSVYEQEAHNKEVGYRYVVISTDNSITFEHEHTGLDDGIWTLISRGFKHHFYINGKHFELQANQGDPFILHDKHLYYTLELNLAGFNYKEADYMSVDLNKYIE
jgi:hypothetical protein